MNRTPRILIWTIVIMVFVGVVGWNLFKWFISAVFHEECETKKTWKIERYEIVEKRCIGFAGPPWNRYYLFQNDKKIDHINYTSDSCHVKFTNEVGDTLQFDLCAHERKEAGNNSNGN